MTSTTLDHKTEPKIEKPKLHAVVLINDDFTTVEFVEFVLIKYFSKTMEEAEQITMDIHRKGKGVAGVYTHEIAESKVTMVMHAARQHDFPLRAEIQPA